MRYRMDHFTPDDHYEALLNRIIGRGCQWIDVGCGKDTFPSNKNLANILSKRCGLLVGVDPSENVEENPFVHLKVKSAIEEYNVDKVFDVATFRMVVEHIQDPRRTIDILKRLIRPGGKVVIYTVNRWSPVTVVSSCMPFSLHHPIKRIFWNTEEKDTFPAVYKMNTRKQLSHLFADCGFTEIFFTYLDDCRMFDRFRFLSFINLHFLRFIKKIKFRYPDNCLLAVYEKN